MKTLHTTIEIDAAPERVWEILTDFAAYPTWNPFITRIVGQPRVGERLTVRLEPPGGMPITMRPTLLEVEPRRTLRWLGRLFAPGLFDGEHAFELEPLTANRTRLVHREDFRGLLVPLLASSLDRHTLDGFRAMNAALKARAEAMVDRRAAVGV